MAQFGDPAGLRRLAAALQPAGSTLATTASGLGGQVDVVVANGWTGSASSAFQAHFDGEYAQRLDLGQQQALNLQNLVDANPAPDNSDWPLPPGGPVVTT
ncbi:MAG TPA: WXG100 family type VII secretion target [Candidatus Dormibacteraeota bacterium]|nr:WXG100 family type VII secretion target [Candidatus Dormibacteraeota bacterium]